MKRNEALKRLAGLVFVTVTVFVLYFLAHFAKLTINVYLIVKSFTPPHRLVHYFHKLDAAVEKAVSNINLGWLAGLWRLLTRSPADSLPFPLGSHQRVSACLAGSTGHLTSTSVSPAKPRSPRSTSLWTTASWPWS
jgi:hypothetical protein